MNAIYLYISDRFFDYNYIEQVLKSLEKNFEFVISDIRQDLLRISKNNLIPISIIPKEERYNFIRDESFAVLIFHDFEDRKAENLIKYCVDRKKLLMLRALPNEEFFI